MFLAEGGADVVLLEARPQVGMGISGRAAGLALVGVGDSPSRLIAAIGEDAAREILHFSLENLDLLETLGVLRRVGGVATSKGREAEEIPETVAAARRLGVPCELWSAEAVNAALGTRGLGPGRFTPAEGLVDPPALLAVLVQRAQAAGVRLVTGATVVRTEDLPSGGGIAVGLADGRAVRAEVVVWAAGAALQALDPWLGDKLYPTRIQMMVLPTTAPERVKYACTAQYGYAYWRQVAPDAVLVGGCRWATPHLETGEADDTVAVPVVEDRIRAFVAEHLPDLAGGAVRQRWTAIMAASCDLLPVVGPVPGRPRFVVCAGFNGHQTSLAVRAAQAVSVGLLEGGAPPGVPAFFKTRRFVG